MVVPIVYDRCDQFSPPCPILDLYNLDRWDKLKRPAQFLAQTRSTLILHVFGTFLMLLAAFIVTISGELSSYDVQQTTYLEPTSI